MLSVSASPRPPKCPSPSAEGWQAGWALLTLLIMKGQVALGHRSLWCPRQSGCQEGWLPSPGLWRTLHCSPALAPVGFLGGGLKCLPFVCTQVPGCHRSEPFGPPRPVLRAQASLLSPDSLVGTFSLQGMGTRDDVPPGKGR